MNSATWRPSVKRRARVKGGRPLFASGSNVAGHGEPLTRVQLQWIEGRSAKQVPAKAGPWMRLSPIDRIIS